MKKFILVMIILFLISCAHQQRAAYVIPQDIKERPVAAVYDKVVSCLNLSGEIAPFLFISAGQKPNAWVDSDNKVYLTEGLFRFDDDTIAFVIAHELSHVKLKHVQNKRTVSLATTGVMIVAGVIVPGLGLLNYAVNPAVTNNYSKFQEYDADKLAAETLVKCFNIAIDKQVQILQYMQANTTDAGGFWDQHPSWSDRIENIKKNP